MADDETQTEETNGGSIDYGGKASEIDKQKQKARDDDARRLAQEHE